MDRYSMEVLALRNKVFNPQDQQLILSGDWRSMERLFPTSVCITDFRRLLRLDVPNCFVVLKTCFV